MKAVSGSETAGLKQIERRPLISPSWIAFTISCAVFPFPGIASTGQPQTDAMYARCSGFVMSRFPGS